ncbi:hypothetical protein KVF89_28810 [Nocardioides carbamazepini]|uniref:DUF5979 domain-containing protein n=1 Tax=Nocardioides carbamazepini TaxID=2854259 RepID=UPI00214A2161|nr:DUF5979 domain-containing protein [Nocardioides carbamazepini]MCR1786570.1 hypothetical protein [Nocardioides carbamazepini]
MTMLSALMAVPPSSAAPDSLQIDKTVDAAAPIPGQTFTYLIQVRCSEDDCLDTKVVDELPAELAGFPIQNVTFSPNPQTVPRTITWQPGGTSTPPATVTAGTSLTVDLAQQTDGPVGIGLQAGTTYTISISLKVPDDYPPGTSPEIVNTARVTASNADPKTSDAAITIESPTRMSVEVDKTWTPGNQPFEPGAASTIGLDVRNNSNVAVDRLTIQEPKNAPNGAAALDASNPFTITDFAGFDGVSVPGGCDTVRVDAYVRSGGTWSWVEGADAPAADPLSLPAGVTAAEVGGIRVTCTGTIPPGQQVSLDLDLEQRATHRNDDGDLSTAEHRVDNTATGSAHLAGRPTATEDDSASYVVRPAIPSVEANKNISPDSITAGQDAPATIAGTNGGVPVTSLTVADLDFFTDEVTFGGFDGPLAWPAAATGATLTYHLLAGGTEPQSVGVGDVPTAPSGRISGFEITWTGPIAADETGGASFTIQTTEDATGGAAEVTLTNKVDVEVEASNGLTDSDTDTDTLRVVDPAITATLDKQVRPGSPVAPGQSVIASLSANVVAHGDGALVHDIVVEDVVGTGNAEFWDAFDLVSIAPTQVPAGTTLTVEVQDTDGTWHELVVHGPQPGATVLRLDAAATSAALGLLGLDRDDVQGIRFSFHDDTGFPTDTTLTPNLEFEARGDLRGGGAITPGPDTPTPYVNAATVTADGESAGGNGLHDDDGDEGTGTVVTDDDGPGPGVEIHKQWAESAVDAQSGDRATTHLDWNVSKGLSPVRISDGAADPATTPVAQTVYDAFDLLRIDPVGTSGTPYTTGWYLRYDTVTEVALHDGSGWVVVPAPDGTWRAAGGGFKGYELTPAQRASTTGVRIVVEETADDTDRREAAQEAGTGFDPFAPAPGTGVGAGSTDRRFSLGWQVRDKARSDGAFVVADRDYNTADEGIVENDTELRGTPLGGGTAVTDTGADTIQILDPEPVVEVAKTVSPAGPVHVPPVGTAAGDYPTATWTISGHNGSTARASYVRLTDPATCTDTTLADCQSSADQVGASASPFDLGADHLGSASRPNPMERFDITGITIAASKPGQIDPAATVVWLLRYDEGAETYSSEQSTMAAVNAGVSNPETIVGISVSFQHTDPATSGGTITQDNDLTITLATRLRPTLRSTGADLVLRAGDTFDVVNRVFAQSYDPVAGTGVKTGDVADATLVLTGGLVNITPTKTITPSLINQPSPDVPVTVTLGANQGSNPRSTLSPQRVVIEDQAESPDFWNTFRFTGLGTVSLPAGADRVQVDVYDGQQWVTGTPAATAALPAGVANADVQGIRFTFTRADGKLFSATVPAPNWTAGAAFTAQLRETYRDSGDPVLFDGDVENTQTSQSTRPDANDSEAKAAGARIELSPGTREIAVRKLTNDGNRTASVGDLVPFDLVFENTGTGYLTLTDLKDTLPPQLVYTGSSAPQFTADPAGTLSDQVTVTPESGGSVLRFTWPADGGQMRPGEVFRIRLELELQPGLSTGQVATNTMVVTTEETLSGCRNRVAGGPLTADWGQDPRTCGTTDYVGTVPGPNLYTVKGVRGSLPGAFVPGNPAATCSPTLNVTGGAYYRSPCVANSQVDGTDDWVLHSMNAGTVDIDEMTVFDQLPVRGDKQLVSGNDRGSAYRPQVVADSLQVSAPAGTTQRIEVTTSTGVCVGTWSGLATQPVCEQNGETWTEADAGTDWSQVTGLRVRLDFRSTAAGALRAGQGVDVTFSTHNVLASDADPTGVDRTVPAEDLIAWNQHGIKFKYAGINAFRQIAPNRVGVHLRTGAAEIRKEITGPAAAYAPDLIRVAVACEAGGVPLDLGADAVVDLRRSGDWLREIAGVPISANGSSCTFTEQGPVGEWGETSRSGTPVTVDIDDPDTVPTATITNDYRFTGLSVTKRVQTTATGTTFGPFTFTLRCESITGQDVTFDAAGTTELEFTLEDGETFTAPADRIPVGAACEVKETDRFFADQIVVTGDNVIDNGDGSATVTPGTDPAEVEITNGYDAGTVTLEKKVDGDGAARYGTGTFTFQLTCTYRGQTPYDDTIRLAAGASRTVGPFAIGTSCAAKETGTGGATTSVLTPADGVVQVPAPAQHAETSRVSLTATNTFRLTSLDVTKEVVGDDTADGAKGPFRVALACTWLVDGQRVALDVPGGAERVLAKGNGYRASYQELPSSASCTLRETKDGGAASTSMTATVAGQVTKARKATIPVDLTPTGGPGEASVRVVNRFDAVAAGGEERGGAGLPNAGAAYRPWQLVLGALLVLAGLLSVLRSRRRPGRHLG